MPTLLRWSIAWLINDAVASLRGISDSFSIIRSNCNNVSTVWKYDSHSRFNRTELISHSDAILGDLWIMTEDGIEALRKMNICGRIENLF